MRPEISVEGERLVDEEDEEEREESREREEGGFRERERHVKKKWSMRSYFPFEVSVYLVLLMWVPPRRSDHEMWATHQMMA